jgi:hypothetical protein
MSSISPTPSTPNLLNQSSFGSSSDIKIGTPQFVVFDDEAVPIEVMTDLVFERIGGQELISVARNDTVNGQRIFYNPIKNLNYINQQFNSKNIISLQQTSDKYFENFPIKLNNLIPKIGNGPDSFNVYLEPQTGDIVIDSIGIGQDQQIEIQISVDGTIYEAEI